MALFDEAKKITGQAVDPLGIFTGTNILGGEGVLGGGGIEERLLGGRARSPDDPQAQLEDILAQIESGQSDYNQRALDALGQGPAIADYSGDFAFTPMADVSLLGPSGLADIQADQGLVDAEMAALNSLQEQAAGGLTARQMADLERTRQQSATAQRGAREAIQSQLQRRGMGGSGLELVAQQQAQQDILGNRALQELEIAAQNQAAQRGAALQAGQLASNLNARDYNRQAEAAKAQDLINQFNLQNQINTQRYNVQGTNDAALANLQRRQAQAQAAADAQNRFSTTQSDLINRQAGTAAQLGGQRYNSIVDQYNRDLANYQAKQAARAGKMKAIAGLGGAGVGALASGGSVQGTQAGANIGANSSALFT